MNVEQIKVLVVGDLMIDHYIYGDCNRISPEAPVPVIEVKKEEYTLGGAGNVLKNIFAFGCKVDIVSVVGDDENANLVINELENYGANGRYLVKDQSRCTIIKSRILATKHQMLRFDKEQTFAVNEDIEKKVLHFLADRIPNYNILLISDYNKGLLTKTMLKEIFWLCEKNKVRSILDPKGLDFSKYCGVNVIKPNKKEAVLATGINIDSTDSLEQVCKKLKEITNADEIVITLSEDGIACYADQILHIIPTKAKDVVDVTGAGDTVLASLGYALASGNSIIKACEFANSAAAVVVNKVGSATVSLDEIDFKFN